MWLLHYYGSGKVESRVIDGSFQNQRTNVLFNSFLVQVCRMAEDTGLDFTDQIYALEAKYQQVNSPGFYNR